MIGASVSGVSFVSVPGMVLGSDMTYLQICLGFIVGYALVAFYMLPIYYKKDAITIYSVFGGNARVASIFFILSDLLGAAVRFFLACSILQTLVFDNIGLPFEVSSPLMVFIIWLYTRKGGIKTLVYTDVIMTTLMLLALIGILFSLKDVFPLITENEHFRVFEFSDFVSTQNFFKQFLSGIFIVIVMTGLNQTMMQKNLTCKNLHDAQKDMSLSGFLFVPVNLLFLLLGVALVIYYNNVGAPLPERGDDLLTFFVRDHASSWIMLLFLLGIISASFSSADSSLTTLTTSVCVDIMRKPEDVKLRKRMHIIMSICFVLVVFVLRYAGTKSLIDTVYMLASYTYGPLLGLFLYSRIQKNKSKQHKFAHVLALCILAPVFCYLLNMFTTEMYGYKFGYELLLLNGLITMAGLIMLQQTCECDDHESLA